MSKKKRPSATKRSRRPASRTPRASRAASPTTSHIERLKKLYELSMTLSGDPVGVFERVARMIGELFDVRAVCLSEVRGTELYFRAVCVNGQVVTEAGHCPLAVTPCATVERTKDLRVFDHVMERFPQATFLRDHHAYAYCGFPSLDSRNHVVAVTCLLDDKPREFSEEDQEVLRIFGQRIAVEIERDHLRAERKRHDKDLRLARFTIEQASDAIYWVGQEAAILDANEAAVAMLGYSKDELCRMTVHDINPDFPADLWPAFWADIKGKGAAVFETSHRAKDGRRIPIEVNVKHLSFEGREYHCAFVRDITERTRAEERLRAHERQLRALVASLDDIVFEFDEHGTYLDVWTGNERLLAKPKAEVIGRRIDDVLGSEPGRPFMEAIGRVMASGKPEETEYSLDVPIGRRAFLARTNPIFAADGSCKTVSMLVRDITDRKQAEEALRQSFERFDLAVQGARDGLWDVVAVSDDYFNPANPIYYAPRMKEIMGVEGDAPDVIGTWAALLHPDDRERVFAALSAHLVQRVPYDIEYRIIKKNGECRWIAAKGQALWDETGRPLRMAGSFSDITERKRLEEELRQAQKMEAVGRLAGGIAHDFNNLLTIVLGQSDRLLRRLPLQDPMQRTIGEIKNAGERAATLTAQLLGFSRKQVLQPKRLSLNELVVNMERLLRRLIGEHLTLTVRLDPALGYVKADPGQLEQVVMNLVLNARDAMPRGGTITLATKPLDLREGDAALQAPPGRYASLIVSDTGEGMDADTQARIFEPFFTTKALGRGTGLGLSMVYGIVTQSGGFISVLSQPGCGATFTICLPQADAEEEPAAVPPAAPAPQGGGETILLAEDEPEVRDLIRDTLEEAGYRVLVARDGVEALAMAERHPAFALLLTDVVMPRMGGRDLAERLEARRPSLPILYMSGYTDDILLPHGVQTFIQKPFSAADLLKKVRTSLEQAH